jgi:hypothetical protein
MSAGYIITSINITYTVTNSATFELRDVTNTSLGPVQSGVIKVVSTTKLSIQNTHETGGTVGQLRITAITITYIPQA